MEILYKNSAIIAVIVIVLTVCVTAAPRFENRKNSNRYDYDEDGKYRPSAEEQPLRYDYQSRYDPSSENDGRYVHVDDMRELGRYVHVHIPYDGGYGPYSGTNIPYVHDEAGYYDFDKYHPKPKPTQRPKRTYYDEGGWQIIRQEEERKDKKYDFLYLTENGIYAEEQGKFNHDSKTEGTSGKGFYEYTGDDGNLYRVEYTAGEEGFRPKLYLFKDQPNPHVKLDIKTEYVNKD